MRANRQWMATVYDGLNRPVITGMLYYTEGWMSLQTFAQALINTLPPGHMFIPLTITHYDDYTDAGKSYTDNFNSKLEYKGDAFYPEEPLSNTAQSRVSTMGLVTYSRVRVIEDPNNLAAGKWLTTVMFYDQKGRVIQSQSDNYPGGTDISTNYYDFTGKLLSNYLVHNNPQGVPSTLTVKTVMSYDHAGRLLETWKTINDEERNAALIARNDYDELGHLKTKKLGHQRNTDGSYSSAPLETMDYNYNIRGWLKGINAAYSHPELVANGNYERWFGMELNYDWGSEAGKDLLNGNISSATWRSKGDGVRRAYGFTYDKASRVLSGDYSQYNGTAYTDNSTVNFDLMMGNGSSGETAYDQNGNIKAMKQWGLKLTGSTPVDQLTYSYHTNSNKLRAVTEDPATSTGNKLGDFTDNNTGADDYGYDRNGNLITDLNKRITGNTGLDQPGGDGAIEYNHLNLPWKITMNDVNNNRKGTITYICDANGNKLQKRVHEVTGTGPLDKSTDYMGSMVYENHVLQFINHEEGRIRFQQASQGSCNPQPDLFVYDYFLKDHLGNIRMVLTDQQQSNCYIAATVESGTVAQEKNYYDIKDGQVEDLPLPVSDDHPSMQTRAYRVKNVDGEKTGLGILIKVMAGDRVRFRAESYYAPPTAGSTAGNTGAVILSQLLGALSGSPAFLNKPGTGLQDLVGNTEIADPLNSFLNDPARNTTPDVPRAFLNYILLDEQLKTVAGGFDGVSTDGSGYKNHDQFINNPVVVNNNGYLCIYVSNESDLKVLFDNLQLTHARGPLLEETHYYPFGLTMQGISSKAAGGMDNRKKYNGIEFTEDLDLDTYDAFYRNLDPQTGRWWQIDPKVDAGYESMSPYASMYDDPARYSDPLGDEADEADGGCPTCPIFLTNITGASEMASKVNNALGTTFRQVLVSAGGVLNGALNTLTLGAWPTNPAEAFTGANNLTTNDQQLYNTSVTLSQDAAMVTTMGEGLNPSNNLKLSPVNGLKILFPNSPFLPTNERANSNSSNQHSTGRTSSGHPTDRNGNKLGPSGKPQVNIIKHSTQKAAKDAARAEGKGTPIKHTNPKKGGDHYHPIDENGNKKPTSTHYEY